MNFRPNWITQQRESKLGRAVFSLVPKLLLRRRVRALLKVDLQKSELLKLYVGADPRGDNSFLEVPALELLGSLVTQSQPGGKGKLIRFVLVLADSEAFLLRNTRGLELIRSVPFSEIVRAHISSLDPEIDVAGDRYMVEDNPFLFQDFCGSLSQRQKESPPAQSAR